MLATTRKLNKRFVDVYPDYASFTSWWEGTKLNTFPINELTFTLIAYEYDDCSLGFKSDIDFKHHFAIDLYTYANEFQQTTEEINKLMNLTDEEIATADSMITNFAEVTEEASSTDTTSLDYVSNQQKVIQEKGKLKIRKEQLSNKRTYTTKTFLKRFKHLFIKVISDSYTPVIGEPEGE